MTDFGRTEEARGVISLAKGGVEWAGIDERILIPNIAERLRKRDDEIEQLRVALAPFCGPGGGPDMQAFHDLEDGVIVWENSGQAVTAGDVRRAREIMGAASMMHFRRDHSSVFVPGQNDG